MAGDTPSVRRLVKNAFDKPVPPGAGFPENLSLCAKPSTIFGRQGAYGQRPTQRGEAAAFGSAWGENCARAGDVERVRAAGIIFL